MPNGYSVMHSPRTAWKSHHKMQHNRAVRGTDNDVKAALGMDGAALCRAWDGTVDDNDIGTYTTQIGTGYADTYRGYNARTAGVKRSGHTVERTGVAVTGMSWDYIMRKCAKLDISLVEYCAMYDFPMEAIAKLAPSA